MKSTGIVRHVDKLDRIVIPKELCRSLGINPKDPLEIFVENSRIVLKKHIESHSLSNEKGNAKMVRNVDSLDRIVIPKEICKTLGIEPGVSMEIFVDEKSLVLGKYQPACIFCNEMDGLILYKGKLVCADCIRKMGMLI